MGRGLAFSIVLSQLMLGRLHEKARRWYVATDKESVPQHVKHAKELRKHFSRLPSQPCFGVGEQELAARSSACLTEAAAACLAA